MVHGTAALQNQLAPSPRTMRQPDTICIDFTWEPEQYGCDFLGKDVSDGDCTNTTLKHLSTAFHQQQYRRRS